MYTYGPRHEAHTQSAQTLQRQDGSNIFVIMQTMCPPGYNHNCFGFVATRALMHIMYESIVFRIMCSSARVAKKPLW